MDDKEWLQYTAMWYAHLTLVFSFWLGELKYICVIPSAAADLLLWSYQVQGQNFVDHNHTMWWLTWEGLCVTHQTSWILTLWPGSEMGSSSYTDVHTTRIAYPHPRVLQPMVKARLIAYEIFIMLTQLKLLNGGTWNNTTVNMFMSKE